MKKIFFLIILFSWFKSEAQNRMYAPGFHLTRSHRWGTFGISTSDTTFYTDSLRIKGFKPLRPGEYTTATAPPASAFPGYIIWNTDSLKHQYSDNTTWINLPGTGGGGGGSGTVTSVALAAGTSGTDVNISGSPITTSGTITLNIPDASATARGLMTTGTQTIAGAKTWSNNAVFNGTATFNGTVQAGGTANGVINIASSAASVRGSIDLASNNPRLNSATGTWLFAQSGSTMGVYNGTGWFLGGGTAPSGFIFSTLAGTATLATYRMNLGVDLTTAVAGSFEYSAVSSINRLAFTATGTNRRRIPLTTDAAPANGQVIIGNGTDFATANITSTGGSITVTNGAGTIDISTTLVLAQGSYTPTLTNGANVAASAAQGTLKYFRIGNQVTVWGFIDIDPTAGGTGTTLTIDLPIASDLTNFNQLSGHITANSANSGTAGTIGGETSANVAEVNFFNGSNTGSITWAIRFTYEVL